MDTTAQLARDREAFREFLEKHRYAPQGRYARVGTLEDKDLDALGRGMLGPVWTWAFRNIKNAEDMEVIQRNVNVARHSIATCKHEREQAKAKREALLKRKEQLEESLRTAREREQALLSSVSTVEQEQAALVKATSDKKQRELLRKGFNEKNEVMIAELSELVDQGQWLATTADTKLASAHDTESDNQVEILLAEFKRMLKSAPNAENVDFSDSDINHLRESSGSELLRWLLEAASRPHDDVPDDDEDAKYAAHVEEHSSSSHDALVQIQNLLRQSQAEHIASFMKTQKVYAKVNELKQRVDEAMRPDDAQYGLWGNENGGSNKSDENALAAETVDLQIQSQANASALHYATRAYDDVVKQVETSRQQKQELERKVDLMNQFDERQQDIVAQIRSKYRHNQELIQSLARKQSRLLQIMTNETQPRVEQDSGLQLTTWSRLVMDELRAFSSLRLGRLDKASVQLSVAHNAITEDARPADISVPFEELFINQIQDATTSNGAISQQRNGYQRMAHALDVPQFASWERILANLEEMQGENTVTSEDISTTIKQLERDLVEDRTQSIPEAQALLSAMQQVNDAVTAESVSRLEEVVHGNNETLQRSIPELEQAIDNWYNQPAWSARLELPSSTSISLAASTSSSTAMEMSDLLK